MKEGLIEIDDQFYTKIITPKHAPYLQIKLDNSAFRPSETKQQESNNNVNTKNEEKVNTSQPVEPIPPPPPAATPLKKEKNDRRKKKNSNEPKMTLRSDHKSQKCKSD